MSVDIKSLRIGSHVEYDGKRVCVDEIRTLRPDGEPMRLIASYNGLAYGNPSIDEVEPIAITPELLKELGLNVISHGCSEHWFLGNFDLTHNTDSCYWEDYEGDIRVEFLHELEDLYYLKYGVELIPD